MAKEEENNCQRQRDKLAVSGNVMAVSTWAQSEVRIQ